jgi:AraC-like DNA-binding protein
MTITYDHNDYHKMQEYLLNNYGGSYNGTTYQFPSEIANGRCTVFDMAGGLQAMAIDYELTTDSSWRRLSSSPEIFILRADYVDIVGQLDITAGKETFSDTTPLYAGMYLYCSRFSLNVDAKKGTRLRNFSIVITREWLNTYFPQNNVLFWLQHIYVMKLNSVNMVPLTFEMRESLMKILQLKDDDPARLFHAQARTFEMADYYFKQIIRQRNNWGKNKKLVEDVDRLIELDVFLSERFNEGIPPIEEMSSYVHMSPTKLKTLFKKVYNQSIHDYFNSNRLNKARNLLLTHAGNLKEISAAVGFKTVQHFASAFKKEFNITPGDLLKQTP